MLDALLLDAIKHFDTEGIILAQGKRNTIKLFSWKDETVAIKSFKKPHFINQIIYTYFRKSKAKRSYEYAIRLQQKNIGTPKPIGYYEQKNTVGLTQSYYVCSYIKPDYTFRDLVEQNDIPDWENILRQFTQFTFELHEKGVEFLDHSPGNTLICKTLGNSYQFYLVDLNRMKFGTLSFEQRMKNMSRLTPHKEMVVIMSNEYAKLSGEDETKVFDTLWSLTQAFQHRFYRKKRLKQKYLFWRKK